MTPLEIKKKLLSDPEFAKLNYPEQAQVWNNLLNRSLSNDQQYLSLSRREQKQVFQRMMLLPPALETSNPYFNELIKYGTDIQKAKNDPNITPEEFADAKKWISSWVNKSAFAGEVLDTGIGKAAAPFVNAVMELQGYLGQDVLYSDDAEKIRDFYRYLNMDDPTARGDEAAARFLGSFLGEAAGFIAIRGPVGAIAKGGTALLAKGVAALKAPMWVQKGTNLLATLSGAMPKTEAAAALGTKVAALSSSGATQRILNWFGGTFIPYMSDATLDGVAGLMMTEIGNIVEGKGNTIFERGFTENLKNFGMYAAGDYLWGTFASIVSPIFKLGGKIVKNTFDLRGKKIKPFTDNKEFQDVMAGIKKASPSQARWIQEIAPEANDLRVHNEYVKNFEALGEKAFKNPVMKTWISLDEMGKIVVPDGDGFRILSKGEDFGKVTLRVNNFSELRDFAIKTYQNATEEQLEYLARQGNKYSWLKQASDMVDDLTAPYSPNHVLNNIVDDSIVREGMKSGDFVNISERSVIHPVEYEAIIKGIDNKGLQAVKGTLAKSAGGDFVLFPNENGKYVNLFKNAASPEEYAHALAIANKMGIDGVSIKKETIADSILISRGYDAVKLADGSIKPLFKDSMKKIGSNVDLETGKVLEDAFVKPKTDLPNSYKVTKTVTGNVPADVISEQGKNLINDVRDIGGNQSVKAVKSFIDDYALGLKKKVDSLVKEGKELSVKVVDGKLEVTIPKDIHKNAVQKQLVEQISEAFDELSGKPIKTKFNITPTRKSALIPSKDAFSQEQMLKESIQAIGGELSINNGIYTVTKNGNVFNFDSADKAFRYWMIEDIGTDTMKATLQSAGYKVIETSKGTKIIKNGEVIVDSHEGFKNTFINADETLLKAPVSLQQTYAIIDGDVGFEMNSQAVIGNKNDLMKHLNKFEDYSALGKMEVITSQPNGTMFRNLNQTYEIRSDRFGYVKKFNTAKEARMFLERIDNFENIYKMVEDKGLRLIPKGNGFIVKGNGKVWKVDGIDDLEKVLKENPIPTTMPDIVNDPSIKGIVDNLEYDNEFAEVIARNPEVISPIVDTPPKYLRENGAIRSGLSAFAPTTPSIVKMAQRVGDNSLVKYFTNLEDGRRLADVGYSKYMDVVDRIFVDSKGKFLSVKERRAVYWLVSGTDPEKIKSTFKDGDKLINDDTLRAASQLRGVYDELFREFGIDSKKFLTDYMPRMYWFVFDNPQMGKTMTGRELFEEAFHGNLPKEMKVFFEQDRVNELVRGLLNDDAYSITTFYVNQGMKKLYMGKPFRELTEYIGKAKSAGLDAVVVNRVLTYLDDLTGSNSASAMKLANEVGKKALKKLMPNVAAGKEGIADQIVNSILSYNYATSMGLKPWLGIRNLFQPWSTLATRFGIKNVGDAYKQVAKLTEEKIKYLVDNGIISAADPIITRLSDNIIGRITHLVMKGFKTSDDITRAIAYYVSKIQFDDGIKKLKLGIIKDLDEWEKYVGLNLIDNKYVVNQVKQLVVEGELETALNRYATQTIEETLFAYRATEKPLFGGRGMFGKLFWMYGTYSAGYVQNVLRGFKNGTIAQKAAFVGRLAATSVIIGGTFKLMGIDNRNFIPWTPMLFSGGPLIDTGYDVIKAFDTGYEGDQARERLWKSITPHTTRDGTLKMGRFIPGSYQFNNIQRMKKAMEEGDSWSAWLFATSTPPDPEKAKNYY